MLKILVAGVLIAHGIGHILGFLPAWTNIRWWPMQGSWLLSGGVSVDSPIGRIVSLFWLAALLLTIAGGVGLLFNLDWWRPVLLGGAVASLIAFLPWLNMIPVGSAVGAIIIDLLVIGGLLSPWGDQLIRNLR
jgi:hypothetical protein